MGFDAFGLVSTTLTKVYKGQHCNEHEQHPLLHLPLSLSDHFRPTSSLNNTMLTSTLICLASALAASAIPMSTRDTDNDPNKAAVDAWLADANYTAPLIIGSRFYTKLDTSSGLDKRGCDAHVGT